MYLLVTTLTPIVSEEVDEKELLKVNVLEVIVSSKLNVSLFTSAGDAVRTVIVAVAAAEPVAVLIESDAIIPP